MAEPTPELKNAYAKVNPELNSQLVKVRSMLTEATDQRPEFKAKENPAPNERLRSLVVESKNIDAPRPTPTAPAAKPAPAPSRSR